LSPVVVTGGAGYIGSHVCKALAARGMSPVTVDNLSRGHREAVRWGPLEVVDLRDRERLAEVLAQHRPQAVLHFAAFIDVGESVRDPALYYENNVGGTLSLLAAMRGSGCSRIVFSSSAAVYGSPSTVPIPESHALVPINPYGWSKLLIEEILSSYDVAYGLRSVSLRYFNAAGADPDGETGEWHDPESHLIPRALDVAAGRAPALAVYGDDYDTPDGTCIRDYVHVVDLAAAHVAALDYLERGGATTALNLGGGEGRSVLELLSAVERVTSRPVPRQFGPRRAGDPPRLVADTTRAREVLGWQPHLSDLSTLLRHAWAWHSGIVTAPRPPRR
jgi:UDP-arabinose 4-epimerase